MMGIVLPFVGDKYRLHIRRIRVATPTTSRFAIPAPLYPGSTAQRGLIAGHWIAFGLALSAACVAALLFDARMTIDPRDPLTWLFAGVLLLFGVTRFVLRTPRSAAQRVARDLSESVGAFMSISLLGATATYPLAADTHGAIDPLLQAVDGALHFDWLAWYQTVAAHRSLQQLGTAAYQSIFVTPALILGYCAWSDRRAEARGFVAAFWLAAVVTLLLFRFVPAVGPLATLWHGPIPYVPESALYEADLFPVLRMGNGYVVDLGALRGLVSVPSFHTASGVVYIAAAWPMARLRWPVLALTSAMLLATPVEGTHYLADMLAGAAVAIVAVLAVSAVRRRLA
ncbi:phosphatase PAP2 family protein [Sphingomonas sp.]|uniref:phosphatase PAP2 family protein n=1 Tax=Sphingomonas sp. TaxID=28214 RepID=UPI00333F7A3D